MKRLNNSRRKAYSLVGVDGNAFGVMGYVIKAMRECGYSNDAITCYREEAMSGDYDNLLSISIMMIDNCNKLSGYDEDTQLMKEYNNDIEYVEQGFFGGNPKENLANESLDYPSWDDID